MNKTDLTIIYYSSNREKPEFENYIQRHILSVCGDLPIISVTQKPMDFGRNICVGDVGANDNNLYRQIQIACDEAKTPFVANAEADCLYPPSYFRLSPIAENVIYRYNNIVILKRSRHEFLRKEWCEGAQIAGREYLLSLINDAMKGLPMWNGETRPHLNPYKPITRKWLYYGDDVPVISVKTGNGLRAGTSTLSPQGITTLPYWGSYRRMYRKLEL